jgi:hypothetical protein
MVLISYNYVNSIFKMLFVFGFAVINENFKFKTINLFKKYLAKPAVIVFLKNLVNATSHILQI